MKKRVFIIHGWGGTPKKEWFLWLKKELEKKRIEVFAPAMPNPEEPKIEEWVPFIANLVGVPDENTYFVGHSIGYQAIMRYLETLPKNTKFGGAVFVAGWFDLTEFTYKEEPEEEEESREIAKPWIEKTIDLKKIKKMTKNFVAIFSDNDPYVELKNKNVFEKEIGAKIIMESNRGHFSRSDGITKLPIVLEKILEMSK